MGLVAVGVAVAVANIVTTRSLWRSPIFERSQKVAQTALIWIVPGSFVVVRHLLREPARVIDFADPTVHRSYGFADDPTAHNHGHGDGDGGHH
jgi:hypothetical protein